MQVLLHLVLTGVGGSVRIVSWSLFIASKYDFSLRQQIFGYKTVVFTLTEAFALFPIMTVF